MATKVSFHHRFPNEFQELNCDKYSNVNSEYISLLVSNKYPEMLFLLLSIKIKSKRRCSNSSWRQMNTTNLFRGFGSRSGFSYLINKSQWIQHKAYNITISTSGFCVVKCIAITSTLFYFMQNDTILLDYLWSTTSLKMSD